MDLNEQAWRRDDGAAADREHLMMTLADLEYVIIKATPVDGTQQTA